MTIEWIKRIKETSGKMWIADDATVSMLCDAVLALHDEVKHWQSIQAGLRGDKAILQAENEQLKRDLAVWESLKTEINDIENEKNSNQ
jgi:hypothetical protein